MKRVIDGKYHIEIRPNDHKSAGTRWVSISDYHIAIVKSKDDTEVFENEPTILFRGRDTLALPMLEYYRHITQIDPCSKAQLESINTVIKKFEAFAQTSKTMRKPGSSTFKREE